MFSINIEYFVHIVLYVAFKKVSLSLKQLLLVFLFSVEHVEAWNHGFHNISHLMYKLWERE